MTLTVLKTEAGTVVSSLTVAGSVAWNVEEPVEAVEPLVTLMMTRAATTNTTRPTASHVNNPAGRPEDALAGGLFEGGFFATVLLVSLETQTY
jgi:hypothetical protein